MIKAQGISANENSQAQSDPNSPLMNTIIPLAISGLDHWNGIDNNWSCISVIDWNKGKDWSRYV